MLAAQSSHLPFYIWPPQITQLYGGDCPANTIDCLTLQILFIKIYNRRFLANPTDKYARQWSSLPPACSSTGSHICHLDLRGIADYIVFVKRICDIYANLAVSSSSTCLCLYSAITDDWSAAGGNNKWLHSRATEEKGTILMWSIETSTLII